MWWQINKIWYFWKWKSGNLALLHFFLSLTVNFDQVITYGVKRACTVRCFFNAICRQLVPRIRRECHNFKNVCCDFCIFVDCDFHLARNIDISYRKWSQWWRRHVRQPSYRVPGGRRGVGSCICRVLSYVLFLVPCCDASVPSYLSICPRVPLCLPVCPRDSACALVPPYVPSWPPCVPSCRPMCPCDSACALVPPYVPSWPPCVLLWLPVCPRAAPCGPMPPRVPSWPPCVLLCLLLLCQHIMWLHSTCMLHTCTYTSTDVLTISLLNVPVIFAITLTIVSEFFK